MSKILAQGMITLTQLYEGAQVILTPSAVLIPCDSQEAPKPNAYINAFTNVRAFLGTMDITSKITLGTLEYSDSTVKASKTGTKVSITAITTRTGYVDIPVSVTIDGETIDLGKHRFSFVKQIDGQTGQTGAQGAPGFSYTLNIKGGTRGVAYAANGTNPEPKTSSQFSVELLKNGVKVANPASISWTCGGNLSGSSSTATFTPTIKSTYNSESSYVKVSVKEFAASLAVEETIPIVCTKHADGLDWINEWNNKYVQVGTEKIITPKIFAGTKNSANELTGVAIGRDVLGGNANKVIGIVGYKKNTPVFSLDQDANFFVSSSGNAGDIKNGTNNAKGIYFDGNNLYVSGKVKISGGSTIGESNTSVEDVINNSNLGVQANNKLNNLSIGGRNLIRKADLAQNNSTATYDGATNTWTVNATAGGGGTWGCGLIVKNKNAVVPYGKAYVLSFEIKVPRACSWNCDVNNYALTGSSWAGNDNDNVSKRATSSKSLVANQWIKCWIKWENTNPNNTNKVDIYDNSNFGVVMKDETSNMTYQIRNVKGELGNVPTEWTPAPEDVQADIDKKANSSDVYKKTETYTKTQTESAIEVAKNEINLGISSTYETKTNVESKISTANTTTLNSAKSYADTKKSEAITQAGKDADSKVNSAKNELNNIINNIEVGGRNLLINCAKYTSSSPLNTQSASKDGYTHHSTIRTPIELEVGTYVIQAETNGTWSSTHNPNGMNPSQKYCSLWLVSTTNGNNIQKFIDMTRSVCTVDIPKKGIYHLRTNTYSDGTTNVSVNFWNIKLEKGNKKTGYSPAIEDVQANIDKKANSTDVYTKSEVFTKAETNSAINVAKDSINLGVSQTYETKANVETKINSAVNNVQIGGRNIIGKDINNISKWSLNYPERFSISNVEYDNTLIYKTTGGGWETAISNGIAVTPNKEYVLSFEYEVFNEYSYLSGETFRVEVLSERVIGNSSKNKAIAFHTIEKVATPRKRVYITFTPTTSTIYLMINGGYISDGLQNLKFSFNKFKLEKGNKATDWTPAPEDIDNNITDVKNSLNSFQNTVNTSFKDGIVEQAEAKAIAQHLKTLDAEKADIDKEYSTIYSNANLTGSAKTNLASAKTSFDSAHASLKSTINTVISDGKVTSSESASVTSSFNTYNTQLGVYKQRVQEALDAISSGKVNGVQVGGTNLVKGTQTFTGWTKGAGDFNEKYGNLTVFHNKFLASGGGYKDLQLSNAITPEPNTTYTLSYWAKGTGAIKNFFYPNCVASGIGSQGQKVTGSDGNVKFTLSSTWTRHWVTWTTTSNVSGIKNLIASRQESADSEVWLCGVKLEKGNKATDWSPAPEDTTADINTAKNEAINSANSTLTTTIANYYTKAQTDSQINVAKDAINLGVSNTYETKANVESKISSANTNTLNSAKSYADTKKNEAISSASTDATNKVNSAKNELNTKINDIQVGGRNLFLNSGFTKGLNYWYTHNCSNPQAVADSSALSRYAVKFTSTGGGIYQRKGGASNNPTNYPNGSVMTVSGYVKSSVAGKVLRPNFENGGTNTSKNITCTNANTWYYFTHTYKIASNGFSTITFYGDSGADYYLKDVMFEYGNKASTWTPAPEDVTADIANAKTEAINSANSTLTTTIANYYTKEQTNSQINIAKEAINLGVSSTYETKANVDTKVSSTLNSAKSYADTKKSEAISSASNDATNKANNALNNAKTYADTKKTEAINTAATDATNKVNSAKNELNTAINKKANSADVYTKSEVYTKAQTDSAIKVAKDEINLGVSSTYETKTNVETKINGISVGGTNLAYDTNKGATGWGWGIQTNSGKTITDHLADGIKGVKMVKDGTAGSGWNYVSYGRFKRDKITPATTYVVSFEMKSNLTFNIGSVNLMNGNSSDSLLKSSTAVQNKVTANSKAWNRIVFKLTTLDTLPSSTAQVIYITGVPYSANATHYFRNLKLEVGNTATAWSPAPEDTATDISTAKTEAINTASSDATSKVNSAKSELNTAIDKKANSADVYKKSETYTKSETDSKINVAKNDITLTVSNTYETKTNVETKVNNAVNNIQVGGRNLAIGTSDAWKSASGFSGATNYCVLGYDINTKTLSVGDKLTVSFRFKCENLTNNNTARNIRIQGSGDVTGWNSGAFNTYNVPLDYSKPTQEIKVNYTFTINADHLKNSKWYINFRTDYITGGTIYLKELLAEKGTKASSWTPAPEDVDSAIGKKANSSDVYTKAETNSQINVAKDNITSSVSQNYLSKGDASNTYATKSSLTQTTNSITAKFEGSGGYNLIKNSSGVCNSAAMWTCSGGATLGYGSNANIGSNVTQFLFLDNGTNTSEKFAFSSRFKLKPNTKYTFTGYFHNYTKCPNFDVFVLSSTEVDETNTGTGYTHVNQLLSVQNTGGTWKKYKVTFTTPASVKSGILRIDNNGYNASGSGSNRVHWNALMLVEGELEMPWSPHPDEVYNNSTVIDATGLTVNNGAIKVKNKAGNTVLSGDSNGNLTLSGTIKSEAGNGLYAALNSGGITFRDSQKSEEVLRIGTSFSNGNRDINGVTFAMPQYADRISFRHIAKPSLENGWDGSETTYGFMEMWSGDYTGPNGSKNYKGVNVFAPMYLSQKIRFRNGGDQYLHEVTPNITWNNMEKLLGVYGDNGTVIGYKSADSLYTRIVVTESNHPGTGDNIKSWGNWNCSGYTVHNATFSGNHVNSYANTTTRTVSNTAGVMAEGNQVRVNFENVQIKDGKAILSIPKRYRGINEGYTIASIVKKGRGDVWVSEEEEERFIIEAENDIKINIEVIIKLTEAVVARTLKHEDSICYEVPNEQPEGDCC